ncbi:MAG: hypothetical protein WB822_16015 [Rhodoplanes sp.]
MKLRSLAIGTFGSVVFVGLHGTPCYGRDFIDVRRKRKPIWPEIEADPNAQDLIPNQLKKDGRLRRPSQSQQARRFAVTK